MRQKSTRFGGFLLVSSMFSCDLWIPANYAPLIGWGIYQFSFTCILVSTTSFTAEVIPNSPGAAMVIVVGGKNIISFGASYGLIPMLLIYTYLTAFMIVSEPIMEKEIRLITSFVVAWCLSRSIHRWYSCLLPQQPGMSRKSCFLLRKEANCSISGRSVFYKVKTQTNSAATHGSGLLAARLVRSKLWRKTLL